jgi:hypothetical protein
MTHLIDLLTDLLATLIHHILKIREQTRPHTNIHDLDTTEKLAQENDASHTLYTRTRQQLALQHEANQRLHRTLDTHTTPPPERSN